MAILDLFKERTPHIVILDVDGEGKEFKIPVAYSVEEVERLLEHQVKIDELASAEIVKGKELQQENDFWTAVFNQLLVLFNHYQPDLTVEHLKKYLTRNEAQKIIAFHTQEQLTKAEEIAGKKTSKKKQAKSS